MPHKFWIFPCLQPLRASGYPNMLYSRIQPISRLKMALTKLSYSQGWSSSVSFASPAHPPPAPCPEGSVPTKICIVLNTFQRRLCFPLEIFSSFSRWPLPTHSANSKLDWTCRIGHPLPLSTKQTFYRTGTYKVQNRPCGQRKGTSVMQISW